MSMLFKRIKDWATSITAFRTGDVIPVDGPSGTAKMSKDDMLRETAENAAAQDYILSSKGFIDSSNADDVLGTPRKLENLAQGTTWNIDNNLSISDAPSSNRAIVITENGNVGGRARVQTFVDVTDNKVYTRSRWGFPNSVYSAWRTLGEVEALGIISTEEQAIAAFGDDKSLNNARPNSIYTIAITSVADAPASSFGGILFTFTGNSTGNGRVQFYVTEKGLWSRRRWGSPAAWSAWTNYPNADYTLMSCNDSVYDTTTAESFFGAGRHADDAPNNKSVRISLAGTVYGIPEGRGTLTTLCDVTNSSNSRLQKFVGYTGTIYERRYISSAWTSWKQVQFTDKTFYPDLTHEEYRYFDLEAGKKYKFKVSPNTWSWSSVGSNNVFVVQQIASPQPFVALTKSQLSGGTDTLYYVAGVTGQHRVWIRADSGVHVSVEWEYIPESEEYEFVKSVAYRDLKPSISIFPSIGVVGSSSASGELYDSNSASKGDHYEFSWGETLGRMAGCSSYVYGHGGLTTRGFISTGHDRGLTKLLADAPKDLYILTLGANDRNVLGEDYLGTSADITTFADTFYGNYSYIISQIINHAPASKIVIMTNYFNRQPNLNALDLSYNQAVLDIASYYGIAVIRPENDPYFLSDFGKALTSGHPRFTGYAAMAKAFVRMIEDEMYANRAYFDDVDNIDVVWPAT